MSNKETAYHIRVRLNLRTNDDQVAVNRVEPGFELAPTFLFTQHKSMITPKNDQSIFGMAAGVPSVQQPAELTIGKRNGRQIGSCPQPGLLVSFQLLVVIRPNLASLWAKSLRRGARSSRSFSRSDGCWNSSNGY